MPCLIFYCSFPLKNMSLYEDLPDEGVCIEDCELFLAFDGSFTNREGEAGIVLYAPPDDSDVLYHSNSISFAQITNLDTKLYI